jgi:hypothetical protein
MGFGEGATRNYLTLRHLLSDRLFRFAELLFVPAPRRSPLKPMVTLHQRVLHHDKMSLFMSVEGQQQTFRDVCVTSALPLKVDIRAQS